VSVGVTLYDRAAMIPAILDGIANGRSLRALCRQEGWPDAGTVCGWLAEDAAFAQQYARAREADGAATGEEVADVARDVLAGKVAPDVGRVAMDGLKWSAARKAPKAYGDRSALEVGGPDAGPIVLKFITRLSEEPAESESGPGDDG
jgi:hypothetical protein